MSFSPVRLSYSELSTLIQKMQQIVDDANSKIEKRDEQWVLTIEDDTTSIELRKVLSLSAFSNAPEVAYEVRYLYWSDSPSVPISEVSIYLTDYSRRITVSGYSEEHVEAVAAFLAENFRTWTVHFRGPFLRTIIQLALPLVGLWLVVAGIFVVGTKRRNFLGAGIVILFLHFTLPLKTTLAGTAVYREDPSFHIKFAPEISLAGLVVGLLALAITIWYQSRTNSGSERRGSTRTRRRG